MTTFPTELAILANLAILAAVLWIPYVVGMVTEKNEVDAFTRPADLTKVRPWVARAQRAQINLLEQLVPFAILVLIIDRLDGFTALTYWTAIAFFWVRILHPIGMISGIAKMPLRPILMNLGFICLMIMAYSVFAARFA